LVKHNEKLPNCRYTYEADITSEVRFACREPCRINSEFCIFHDKDHYAEHEQEATKRFEEKVLESISQNKSLECFGYYLPGINFAKVIDAVAKRIEIELTTAPETVIKAFTEFLKLLRNKVFPQPVYFSKAAFSKEVDFTGTEFSKGKDQRSNSKDCRIQS
jgi:hypothetical protein